VPSIPTGKTVRSTTVSKTGLSFRRKLFVAQRLKRGVLRERQIGLITGDLLLPFIPTKGATCSLSQRLDGLYTLFGRVPDAQRQAAMMQLELRGIKIDRYQLLSFWRVLCPLTQPGQFSHLTHNGWLSFQLQFDLLSHQIQPICDAGSSLIQKSV
jgi:hypothetical protein